MTNKNHDKWMGEVTTTLTYIKKEIDEIKKITESNRNDIEDLRIKVAQMIAYSSGAGAVAGLVGSIVMGIVQ